MFKLKWMYSRHKQAYTMFKLNWMYAYCKQSKSGQGKAWEELRLIAHKGTTISLNIQIMELFDTTALCDYIQ